MIAQPDTSPAEQRLGAVAQGFRGTVAAIAVGERTASSLTPIELESRLLEFGFVEGAHVEVLHQGPIGGDPIAVRVNNITIALRRREAMAVVVAVA